MRRRIVSKNTKPKEKNVNPFPKGPDTLIDYTVDQTLSGVCYSWPIVDPKVFVRSQGKSWYWHIPSALEPWSALDDNAPLNGLFPTPEEALKAGRDYFYREVYSPTPEDLNEKEED